ncbi:hypothetical protein RUM44_005609 [Polyplax serrata]|uniref:Uncharacterized protein n=1 Tax=Polyplax serrata TaxID=468196 RepID=A0ABR1AF62_POLSC
MSIKNVVEEKKEIVEREREIVRVCVWCVSFKLLIENRQGEAREISYKISKTKEEEDTEKEGERVNRKWDKKKIKFVSSENKRHEAVDILSLAIDIKRFQHFLPCHILPHVGPFDVSAAVANATFEANESKNQPNGNSRRKFINNRILEKCRQRKPEEGKREGQGVGVKGKGEKPHPGHNRLNAFWVNVEFLTLFIVLITLLEKPNGFTPGLWYKPGIDIYCIRE